MVKPQKLLLAGFFLILFGINTPAQLAKIAGIVLDPQPARITQAKIVVVGTRDKKEFFTDDEGFFQGNLRPGWYTITVSHYGFRTRKFRVLLKPDIVTPVNVVLTVPNQKIGKCPRGMICL